MTVSPSTSQEIPVNTKLRCLSTNGASSTTYQWLNGVAVASSDAMVTVSEAGPFFLTCVANFAINGVVCIDKLNVSGTAYLSSLHFVTFNQGRNGVDGVSGVETLRNNFKAAKRMSESLYVLLLNCFFGIEMER